MPHSVAHRAHLGRLTEQLMAEYAGVVPPGQVLVIVHRTHHLVADLPFEQRLEACEEFARRLLEGRRATAGAVETRLVG